MFVINEEECSLPVKDHCQGQIIQQIGKHCLNHRATDTCELLRGKDSVCIVCLAVTMVADIVLYSALEFAEGSDRWSCTSCAQQPWKVRGMYPSVQRWKLQVSRHTASIYTSGT